MSTSATASTLATLGTNALPRPDYLQGKGYDDKKDRIAISALRIYENGRLSNQPCQLCVNNDKDCVVDSKKSSRCAWCSYKSMKNRECCAEGVKPFMTLRAPTDPPDDNAETLDDPVTNAAPQTVQATNAAPELSILTPPATADFKVTMTRPNAYNVHHSVFPYRANSITGSTKLSSDVTKDTNQKRKRRTTDLADAETATKRTRPMPTEHASPGSEVVGSFFTPINVPTTAQDIPTVTGHFYAPIAPKPEPIGQVSAPATRGLAKAQNTATEHPYAPTAPKSEPTVNVAAPASQPATTEHLHSALMEHCQDSVEPGIAGYVSAAVTVPVMVQDLTKSRLAPAGSIEYDLAIRTNDPVKWAQWAKDLHKEIGRLRHVQDLGPCTMNIVTMMIEDGIWPPYTSTFPEEEEAQ